MRVMTTVAATAAAGALLLTGCASGADDGGHGGSVAAGAGSADGAAGAETAVGVDPCDGADDCTYVGQADVDGDGTLDQIGVVLDPAGEASTAGLRVAIGGTVHTLDTEMNPNTYPTNLHLENANSQSPSPGFYEGAFQLTRSGASDIVVHHTLGRGNVERFLVAAWNGSDLEWVPAPDPSLFGVSSDPEFWSAATSHGKRTQYACKGDGNVGVETVYAATAEGMPQPKGDTRDIALYRYADGQWTAEGTENVPDVDEGDFYTDYHPSFQCSDETLPAQ